MQAAKLAVPRTLPTSSGIARWNASQIIKLDWTVPCRKPASSLQSNLEWIPALYPTDAKHIPHDSLTSKPTNQSSLGGPRLNRAAGCLFTEAMKAEKYWPPYHGKLVLNGSCSFCSVKFIPHCPPVEFQASLQSFHLPQLLSKSRGVSGFKGKERPQEHNPNSSHCSLFSYSDQVLSQTIHQTVKVNSELSRYYWVHWLPGANWISPACLQQEEHQRNPRVTKSDQIMTEEC